MTLTIADKRARFAELHAAPGCFVIPNPFDIGSAKYLASLGFPALASTSAGMAFAAGKGDGAVDRAYTLSHLRDLAEATDLPLNADFEAGFARDADGVHESVAALRRRWRLGLVDRRLHRQFRRSPLQRH